MVLNRYYNLIKVSMTYLLIKGLKNKELIVKECDDWLRCKSRYDCNFSQVKKMYILLVEGGPYRNCLLKRISENNSVLGKVTFKLTRYMWKPMNTLFINTKEIGEGFLVNHGFATIITAESIGKDCLVGQDVTIGVKEPCGKLPKICNNVSIWAGAKVLGGITVGDNSVIGANAVVTKDIPPNGIWGGYQLNLLELGARRKSWRIIIN